MINLSDIEWPIICAIRICYPNDSNSFKYRAVPKSLGRACLNFDVVQARSFITRDNGALLHKVIRQNKKRSGFIMKFVQRLRLTPSDFAAAGLPWPQWIMRRR